MTDAAGSQAIDRHIAQFAASTRRMLEEVRAVISAAAPEASETISYGAPAFDLDETHLVHFAGYARHLGFYPGADAIAAFEDELGPCKRVKGSVRFLLDRPLPADVIRRMVEYRSRAVTGPGPG